MRLKLLRQTSICYLNCYVTHRSDPSLQSKQSQQKHLSYVSSVLLCSTIHFCLLKRSRLSTSRCPATPNTNSNRREITLQTDVLLLLRLCSSMEVIRLLSYCTRQQKQRVVSDTFQDYNKISIHNGKSPASFHYLTFEPLLRPEVGGHVIVQLQHAEPASCSWHDYILVSNVIIYALYVQDILCSLAGNWVITDMVFSKLISQNDCCYISIYLVQSFMDVMRTVLGRGDKRMFS